MVEVTTQNRQEKKQDTDTVHAALEVVIDGVCGSECSPLKKQAGVYIAGLILADQRGMIDPRTQKAIVSIIEMAAEMESPVFRT